MPSFLLADKLKLIANLIHHWIVEKISFEEGQLSVIAIVDVCFQAARPSWF